MDGFVYTKDGVCVRVFMELDALAGCCLLGGVNRDGGAFGLTKSPNPFRWPICSFASLGPLPSPAPLLGFSWGIVLLLVLADGTCCGGLVSSV